MLARYVFMSRSFAGAHFKPPIDGSFSTPAGAGTHSPSGRPTYGYPLFPAPPSTPATYAGIPSWVSMMAL